MDSDLKNFTISNDLIDAEGDLSLGGEQEDEESSDDEELSKSPPIKRTVSLPRLESFEDPPDLPKIAEVEDEENEGFSPAEDKLAGGSGKPKFSTSAESKSPNSVLFKSAAQKNDEMNETKFKDSPYDEDFFYYLEMYLDEAIKSLCHGHKLQTTRNRSRSEV